MRRQAGVTEACACYLANRLERTIGAFTLDLVSRC
ncbi:hypothetical protein ABH987_008284, partial [Bradyrhizobium ottawaense]